MLSWLLILLLGAMLLDQDAISQVIDIIDDSDFYRDAHRKIFQAVILMYSGVLSLLVSILSLGFASQKLRSMLEINEF